MHSGKDPAGQKQSLPQRFGLLWHLAELAAAQQPCPPTCLARKEVWVAAAAVPLGG